MSKQVYSRVEMLQEDITGIVSERLRGRSAMNSWSVGVQNVWWTMWMRPLNSMTTCIYFNQII